MTKDRGPYSRVYHAIADDPQFGDVFDDDAILGCWLRMLLLADAVWPTSAPMPRRNRKVTALLGAGLVVELPGNRYTIRGLAAERERRSSSARNAAAVRWHSPRNAEAMPRRDETSKDKKSNGADASREQPVAMGFQQRPRKISEAEMLADIERQHAASREMTLEAAKRKREGGTK